MKLFGSLTALSSEEHQAIYEATGIDIDNRNKFFEDHNKTMTTLILGFIDFAKVIPGFMDLPVSDQASLLKGNVLIKKGGGVSEHYLKFYH
jgi:hypothetical protein